MKKWLFLHMFQQNLAEPKFGALRRPSCLFLSNEEQPRSARQLHAIATSDGTTAQCFLNVNQLTSRLGWDR